MLNAFQPFTLNASEYAVASFRIVFIKRVCLFGTVNIFLRNGWQKIKCRGCKEWENECFLFVNA